MTEHRIPEEHDITEADQARALDAIRATEHVTAPPRVHAAVAAMAPRPAPVWRRPRPLAFAGALAAAAAVLLVLVLPGGGASAPTVAEATRAALAPARAAPPSRVAGSDVLAAEVGGVSYPYWSDSTGWRAVGARSDVVEDRAIRTIAYADARGRTIGYAIAAGDALPRHGGRVVERRGIRLWVLRVDGADVVTWERGGHTCILASRDVGSDVMLGLATGTAA